MRRLGPDISVPAWGSDGPPLAPERIVERLRPFVTDARASRIEHVLTARTRRLTLVLDGIHDPHNAAAVLRSCEALGIQDVHVIEREQTFVRSRRVTQGADQWLSLVRHADGPAAVRALREKGYALVAADAGRGVCPADVRLAERVALLVGNEHDGLGPALREAAEAWVRVPMRGFSESLNLSVAAALLLGPLRDRMGSGGDLDEHDKVVLRARFYRLSVPNADRILGA